MAEQVRMQVRMVRWMCGVKLKDRVSNKDLRERLGIVDIKRRYYSKTGYDGMDMCCERILMIG